MVRRIAFFAIFPFRYPSQTEAHDGNRTHGHTLTKGVLYRLSYVGP